MTASKIFASYSKLFIDALLYSKRANIATPWRGFSRGGRLGKHFVKLRKLNQGVLSLIRIALLHQAVHGLVQSIYHNVSESPLSRQSRATMPVPLPASWDLLPCRPACLSTPDLAPSLSVPYPPWSINGAKSCALVVSDSPTTYENGPSTDTTKSCCPVY